MNAAIRAAMESANANVLTETGLMLRTCEHGIRHPAGHVDPHQWAILARPDEQSVQQLTARHERRQNAGYVSAACCGCCPHRIAEAQIVNR